MLQYLLRNYDEYETVTYHTFQIGRRTFATGNPWELSNPGRRGLVEARIRASNSKLRPKVRHQNYFENQHGNSLKCY